MVLLALCYELNLPIVAIHINHQLQAPSDNWESLVQQFCQIRHIPFTAIKLRFDNPIQVNEQQARQARYEAIIQATQLFLSSANTSLQAQHIPVIALAHHANDQVETILMNLCQGTGLHGLAGMQAWAYQTQFSMPIYLWRPLLSVTREQISDFIHAHHISYVDDPTNVAGDNQRAFLRQHIMPLLAARFGGLVQNIQRTSHNVAEASTILHNTAMGQLQTLRLPSWTRWQACLSIAHLRQLRQDERFYLLHYWLKFGNNFAPPRRFIEDINALILLENTEHHSILQWQDQQIRRYRGTLFLLKPPYIALLKSLENQRAFGSKKPPNCVENGSTIAMIANHALSILVTDNDFLPHLPNNSSLIIRPVLMGEKFKRLNHPHHSTFKNISQTLHIPSWERVLAWVVETPSSQSSPFNVATAPAVSVALVFPTQAIWLAGAGDLGLVKEQPCPFKLQFE